MTLMIEQEKKEPLLQRKEIHASWKVQGKGTPTTEAVTKAVAEHYKVDLATIKIYKIKNKYRSDEVKIHAAIYETAEACKKYSTIAKKPKKQGEAEAAKQAAPKKK